MFWLGVISRKWRSFERGSCSGALLTPSAEFLDSVIENIPNMLFIKDARELRFVRINKAGEELLGLRREQLLGKNDYDFFPQEQADFFTGKDRAVLQGREMVDIPEEPIDTRSGTRILHTKKIPWLDASGRPLFLIGISEDITDRMHVEKQRIELMREQLARAETEKLNHRLKLLAEASRALNCSLDLGKTMQEFARGLAASFGEVCVIDLLEGGADSSHLTVAARDPARAEEFRAWRASHPLDLHAPAGPGAVLQSGECEAYVKIQTRAAPYPPENDLEFLAGLGVCTAVVVPLRLGDRVLGAMTVASGSGEGFGELDLSIAKDLAARAALAIEHARLYREAREANRAKTAFLANMSHEVRTPLAAVLGFARIVHEDPELIPDHRHKMELIMRNGEQLLRIVDEILDISKVESDRMDLELLFFNVRGLIQEVVSLLAVKAEEKGIRLELDLAADLPDEIRSDPTRLRQALINVLGNAVKFTSSGSVRLQAQLLPSVFENGAPRLLFRVSDTGIGLSADQAAALFQPFAQADNSMTRKFGGTGLGLFLSRRLARMLGGDLVLESSTPGQGSIFALTIEPRESRAASEAPSTPVEPRTAPFSATTEMTRGHLLVVDDSEDNRYLVTWYLKKLGFTSDVAENGREGLRKALAGSYRSILLDIQMPEMDGFQVVGELRRQGYRGEVIALTAHAMKGDRERCLEAGFDDYLTKPLDENKLRRLLLKSESTPRPSEPATLTV